MSIQNAPASSPLTKSYEPQVFETELYKYWENQGCFEASDTSQPGQKSFCIMIPPPNVTGVLHMGHALTNTIQDILSRWRRMSGDNVLWLPGTDHAGIATQVQVEKQIAKEGKGPTGRPLTRYDLGREKFIERVWQWKEKHGGEIVNQLKRLGSSLDWKRERFTMDEGLSKAVREVFVRLHEEGLIYRGERIINWCTRCQTALSDLEVIPTDKKGHFWHLKYKIVEPPSESGEVLKEVGELVIATTRPETLLGDSAVAVHPDDDRYKAFHGKMAVLPLLGRLIPVITDTYVDREFGSGALKITPSHDFNDYEIGKRHHLPFVSVMGKEGKMTAAAGPYADLKFAQAREQILQDLKEKGLLVRSEDHAHKIGLCERCDTVSEPIISKQWFVKIEPLAKPAIAVVENGEIQFSPEHWKKTYFEWMYNIRDWCISRQLWWGHQIPAWYCGECQEITVARLAPEKCAHCGAAASELKQDEDVLDTWFSSALWPFSTLGWPDQTKALETFYPTTILETGFDIIFFWVSRMIMMGKHFMGDVPFKRVYLHAMVRDEKGDKMSKSKGNVIDPLLVMNQHGTDPLRFTLAAMAGQGRDIKLSVDRVEGYRGFCNKLWNAVKFFHMQFEQGPVYEPPVEGLEQWIIKNRLQLPATSRWIISRLERTIEKVEYSFEHFEINEAAQALYAFTWNELCDWYIEFSKQPLRLNDEGKSELPEQREQTLHVLAFVIERLLRTLHPIMPFVTEQLWQSLSFKKARALPGKATALTTIMWQEFPKSYSTWVDLSAESEVVALQNVINAIRNFRGENSLSPKVKFTVHCVAKNPEAKRFLENWNSALQKLTQIEKLVLLEKDALSAQSSVEAILPLTEPAVELRIGLKGLVNVEEETKRLQKEIDRVKSDIAHVQKKLATESFMAKAPAALIEKERKTEADGLAKLKELEQAMANVQKLK